MLRAKPSTCIPSGPWDSGTGASILHALALVLAQLIAFTFGVFLLAPLFGLGRAELTSGSPAALALSLLLGCVSVLGIIGFGLLRLGRVSVQTLGWKLERWRTDLLWSLLGLGGCVASMLLILELFGLEVSELPAALLATSPSQRIQLIFIGLSAVLTEESLFRGYLQPALTKRWGAVAGIVATATIFAAYHLPLSPHPAGLTAKLFYGVIWGCLRHRTDSLLPGAASHFLFIQLMAFE